MKFEKWAELNKISKFLKQHNQSKAAWNAAIDEAVKVVDVKDSEFPDSLIQQVIILIKELKQ
jgi:hypothetical protein